MSGSSERGIAIIGAMLMMTLLSAIGASLVVVAQTETLSTMNYKTMSQARYAAESGVHRAAHYLMFTYATPTVADLASYDLTTSPVEFGGAPVVLSSDPDVDSNYPTAGVVTAFEAAATGALAMGNNSMSYSARATLMSMRTINDAYGGTPRVLQTWEVTGIGAAAGSSNDIEVSAVIERQVQPAFSYAAFATADGCAAISFAGGATTDSYDSRDPLVGGMPVLSNTDGNIGSNGNLDQAGAVTSIGGSMSTPRAGVGNCTSNNVTAQEISGGGTVAEGLVQLPQPLEFPDPDPPSVTPPTTSNGLSSAECAVLDLTLEAGCSASGTTRTITPSGTEPVVLGNVDLDGGLVVTLNAGTYIVNSLDLAGNAELHIGTGPVVIQIAGEGVAIPLDLTGGTIVNDSYDPSNLQIVYGGTGELRLRGGAQAAAVVYAPNATTSFAGGADYYGAVITRQLTATGGSTIHYDRALMESDLVTIGNFTMNTFTWSTF